jgi:hypothetical protein
MEERMSPRKTAPVDPLAFIALHGVVLQSATHPMIPSLASAIAGEAIKGSWWGHEKGREIFRALSVVYESPDVVATNLVDGKLTLIHRRLWTALTRLTNEGRIDPARMAKVTQEHTDAGHHEKRVEPFPEWLPRGMKLPSVEKALSVLGEPLAGLLLRPAGATPRSPASAGRGARARRR